MSNTLLRAAAALSLTLAITACTPATDDTSADTDVAAVSECPVTEIITVADYPAETLPTDAATFHAENGERDNVQTTVTGLQYSVVKPGIEGGLSPEPGEYVAAHYKGFLIDGTVFDSSYERDQPLEFATNRVIPGWTQAIEDMTVCEARTLYIPSDIAYGSRGAGNVIPPNTSLVFNVQLLRVDRAQDTVETTE